MRITDGEVYDCDPSKVIRARPQKSRSVSTRPMSVIAALESGCSKRPTPTCKSFTPSFRKLISGTKPCWSCGTHSNMGDLVSPSRA